MTDQKPMEAVATDALFVLHLLDPNQGHPLMTWKFPPQEVVRIGRTEQNEVVIADPYVSRNHAELRWRGDYWQLVNLGRNGTFVAGMQVAECRLDAGATFRLGQVGPTLQYGQMLAKGSAVTYEGPQQDAVPCIEINLAQKEQQVAEIVESTYFQQLQQMAKQMKNRSPAETGIHKRTNP